MDKAARERNMPITIAYEAKIEHISILDAKGNFDEKLGGVGSKCIIPDADIVKLYAAKVKDFLLLRKLWLTKTASCSPTFAASRSSSCAPG